MNEENSPIRIGVCEGNETEKRPNNESNDIFLHFNHFTGVFYRFHPYIGYHPHFTTIHGTLF